MCIEYIFLQDLRKEIFLKIKIDKKIHYKLLYLLSKLIKREILTKICIFYSNSFIFFLIFI